MTAQDFCAKAGLDVQLCQLSLWKQNKSVSISLRY